METAEKVYSIEQHETYVQVTFTRGALVSSENILEALSEQKSYFDETHRAELWDFRGCLPHPNLTFNSMAMMVRTIQKDPNCTPGPPLAILVASELQYGLSRMYQILASEHQPEIGIFSDSDKAQRWITEH